MHVKRLVIDFLRRGRNGRVWTRPPAKLWRQPPAISTSPISRTGRPRRLCPRLRPAGKRFAHQPSLKLRLGKPASANKSAGGATDNSPRRNRGYRSQNHSSPGRGGRKTTGANLLSPRPGLDSLLFVEPTARAVGYFLPSLHDSRGQPHFAAARPWRQPSANITSPISPTARAVSSRFSVKKLQKRVFSRFFRSGMTCKLVLQACRHGLQACP